MEKGAREGWDLTTVDGVRRTVSGKEVKVVDQSQRQRGLKMHVIDGGGGANGRHTHTLHVAHNVAFVTVSELVTLLYFSPLHLLRAPAV